MGDDGTQRGRFDLRFTGSFDSKSVRFGKGTMNMNSLREIIMEVPVSILLVNKY